ncbi:MAG: hypothetical protein EOM20_10605 [Spartobacteria bacterium]|nr:hypothetical protein [Spartobacteria bacterium]
MKGLNVLLGLLLAATVGCIKVEQDLTIDKDGSGSMVVQYGMAEQSIAQMEAMKEMAENMPDVEGEEAPDDDNPFDFDEETIREQFKALEKDGVKLTSVKSEAKDGWKYMNIAFSFEDLNALAKTDFFKGSAISLTKDAEGNYVLVQKSGNMTGMNQGDVEMDPEMEKMMLQQMAPMFAGMRIAMTIKTPGKILETNASVRDGDDKASWIYDVDKDPNCILQMQKADIRVVFEGEGVTLPEINIEADAE